MSIRLGNTCLNCEKYREGYCMKHETSVTVQHTCDSFKMKAELKDEPNCSNCARYNNPTCANPQKAAPGMLCNHWAPQARA